MNIVEKEAHTHFKRLYSSGQIASLENLKSNITTKLYDFNRDRDKLDFLKTLRTLTTEDVKKHIDSCPNKGCGYEEKRELGIFVIDQEIEAINEYFKYVPKSKNQFSEEEESNLQNKLNEILEKLDKQADGQEIIFEEIEELKNHFNLGKKNWLQLFKGKLFDLSSTKIIEKTLVDDIINTISQAFENTTKLID